MKPKGALEVILFADRKFVGSLVFTSNTITVGSDAKAMVRLDDPRVAPEHAVITFTGRTCIIEDQGTPAGTFCKNARIESHLVQPTDEIAIGRYALRFVVHQASGEAQIAAPQEPAPPIAAPPVAAPSIAKPPVAAPPAAAPPLAQPPVAAPPVAAPPIAKPPVAAPPPAAPPVAAPPIAKPPVAAPPVAAPPVAAPPIARPPVASPPIAKPPVAAPPIAKPPAASPPVAAPPPAKPPVTAQPPVPAAPAAPATKIAPPSAAPKITPAAPPTPPPHHADEDDDEDEDFVPSFSLVRKLSDYGDAIAPGSAVVQAVFSRDEIVVDLVHVLAGERFPIAAAAGRGECVHEAGGRMAIRFPASAGVRAAVRRRAHAEFEDHPPGEITLVLQHGEAALLQLGDHEELLLQFVTRTAALPKAAARFRPDRQGMLTAVAAVAVHFLIVFLFSVMPSENIAAAVSNDPTEGRFAMIEMRDPLMDAPKPKTPPKKTERPKPPKKITQAPTPSLPPPPMPSLPPSLRNFVSSHSKAGGGTTTNPHASPKANQVFQALSNVGPSAAASAVTNLNVVTGAKAGSGGFNIGGAVARIPGGGLSLGAAGGGTGTIGTRGGADVTQGGKLGRVASVGGSGTVRGLVKQTPARAVEVQGELDRGEIQKVVNSHIHEVQGCYERRLVKDPTLAGKVVMDWTIMPTGSVGVVRVKFSDVRDTEVSTCIQASMRLWRFPAPKGGSVTVTYPFVFSTIGL